MIIPLSLSSSSILPSSQNQTHRRPLAIHDGKSSTTTDLSPLLPSTGKQTFTFFLDEYKYLLETNGYKPKQWITELVIP